MNVPEPISAKLVISGTFECRDADGNLVKTIELKSEVPLTDLQQEQANGDQRSE
jgi:hypothetical protein